MVQPIQQLGFRIKTLREQRGLSQRELSLMIGINRAYIGDLELGKRNPTFKVLQKIAKGFDITLEELFKGID